MRCDVKKNVLRNCLFQRLSHKLIILDPVYGSTVLTWWTSDASYLTSKKMSSWWILLPIEKRSSGVKSRMSNSSFADMQKWVGCLKQRSLCGFLIYCYDRIFVIGRWISYSYKYYGDIVMCDGGVVVWCALRICVCGP